MSLNQNNPTIIHWKSSHNGNVFFLGKSIYAQIHVLGGTLEAYYWCYGDTDFMCIMDVPDSAKIAKLSLHISELLEPSRAS